MGGDADEFEVAGVVNGEVGRAGGECDDAAGGEGDGGEAGVRGGDEAGAFGDEEVGEGGAGGGGEGVAGPGGVGAQALDAEVVFVDEEFAVEEMDGLALAGPGGEACGLEGEVDVELAGAAVVEHAIGEVAVLLGLKEYGAGPDGVDGAGVDVDELAGEDGQGLEAGFEGAIGDAGADFVEGGAGEEAACDLSAGFGGEGVPALGFAAGEAEVLGHGVVGMDLDAELLLGEEDFEEEG